MFGLEMEGFVQNNCTWTKQDMAPNPFGGSGVGLLTREMGNNRPTDMEESLKKPSSFIFELRLKEHETASLFVHFVPD